MRGSGYWSGFRLRLFNKILLLVLFVIFLFWVIGKVEFHGLPDLSGKEKSEPVAKTKANKKALQKRNNRR